MKRLLVLLLLIPLVHAFPVTVTTEPSINATTAQTIHCIVTATSTGMLSANITWYRDGTPHGNDNQTISLVSGVPGQTTAPGAIEPGKTTKGEQWTCEATVTNGTTTQRQNATDVTIINSPPYITRPIERQILFEDSTYNLEALAHDPDGDPIMGFFSISLNESFYGGPLFTIASDGLIEFTPDWDMVGNHSMVISATDGELLGGRTVIFEVLEVDDYPILGPLTDQEATEGDAWDVIVTAWDEEGDLLNFSISSPLPELIITQINATRARIHFTSGTVQYRHGGVHTVHVTVYQNLTPAWQDTGNFTLTITTINQVPSITGINYTERAQGQPFTLNVTATDPDDIDTLNFTVHANCSLPNPWTIDTINNSYDNGIGRITVGALTNDHIACRNITITVWDQEHGIMKSENSTTLILNITNTNDPPVINEISWNNSNTRQQYNMSNLTAVPTMQFRYKVNATDVDSLTYEGETLTFNNTGTLFTIHNETGIITFTPTALDIGIHTSTITVTDRHGATDSRELTLEVIANSPPVLVPVADLICDEDANCTTELRANDPDGGTLTFTVTNVHYETNSGSTVNPAFAKITINQSAVQIWKNFTNLMVGNYTYNITVRDPFGLNDSQLWDVEVRNTNDPPIFDNTWNNISDILEMPQPVVVGYEVFWLLNASDPDFVNVPEVLTLTASIDGPNPALFTPTKISDQQWRIQFTPTTGDIGSYIVNITVTDLEGAFMSQNVSFTVYNQSVPPNITHVRPFYNSTNGVSSTGWSSAAGMGGWTNVTFAETQVITYNIQYSDHDTADENMTITWYIDNEEVHRVSGDVNTALTRTYDYFSAGNYTYHVVVEDDRYETDTFTWNVTITDTNRPPKTLYNLTDREINSTTVIIGYMRLFIDPDDDLNSNDIIDAGETNRLEFTHSSAAYLNITFDGTDITLQPIGDGQDNITFTATDPQGAFVHANVVQYNVTLPPDEQQSSDSQTQRTGGSSGGGGAQTVVIPLPVRADPEPISIEILIPEAVTIYYNQTISVPVSIQNPSDITLYGVSVDAFPEAENVTYAFSRTYWERIEPGGWENLTLTITNYRDPGSYGIAIKAMSTTPELNDTALLYINSLEQASHGDDVHTRITFAQDLLSANPECMELNELITQAQRALQTGQNAEADRLLNAVIDGCRYLVTESLREERPAGFDMSWLLRYQHMNLTLAALLIIVTGIGALLFLHHLSASREDQ